MFWKDLRTRGLPVVAIACLAVLLAAGLAVSLVSERNMRDQLAREGGAQADLLASAVSGALAFDDRAAARDYVEAVQVNPNVLAAAVYDARNRKVVSFGRPGEIMPEIATPRGDSTLFRDGHIYVVRRVVEGGQLLGTARIRMTATPAGQRFSRNAGLILVLALAALLVAVLALTQSALRRANLALSARAEDLAAANVQLHEQMVEREKAEEALRQSQKMEAIGRLTGGVAHDFNNLLMVVSSAIDLLARTEDPTRRVTLVDGMRQAVERGAGLTRQLLAFSRRAPLKTAVVDVGRQVENMRILLERSLREDIAVRIGTQGPLRPVDVDVGELELAILNLAVNARDAMPDGGELSVVVRGDPAGSDAPAHICIEVADTGSGISEAVLPRIFEPFFTTKEVGQGTGLGLSQVYGFARSSGGEVSVRSRLGEGAVFTLCLPATDKPAEVAPEPVAPPAVAGAGRVLLVEDDDAVAAGVGHMLRDLGYTYVRACSGDDALKMFREDRDFDLVLSDMVMPGRLGGLACAIELRALNPDLPIILSTGFSEAASAATANGFPLLSKPYSIDDLARLLAAQTRGAIPA